MPRKYLFYIEQNYAFAIVRPIQQQILARQENVAWLLVGEEVNRSLIKEDEILLDTVADAIKFNPDVVIVPGNTVPDFLPGLKVEVFHGFNARKRTRGGLDSHFAIRGCFDLYCTQGPSTTIPFKKLQQKYQYFDVIETGWPKVDPLFSSNKVTSNLERDERPLIMLTSTFSEKLSCAETVFPEIKRLVELGKWRFQVQFHPKMAQKTVELYQSIRAENYCFIETDNVMPFLQEADLMVSDTSSILQEFILQRKPVVTINNRRPGNWLINIQSVSDIEKAIEKGLSKPTSLLNEIDKYIADLHPYTDGKSAIRVLQAIDQLILEGTKRKRKPKNWLRNFKMRKKLGYWKL